MKASADRVVLVGEPPLVEEYAGLFRTAGFSVTARSNSSRTAGMRQRRAQSGTFAPRTAQLAIELTNVDLATKRRNLLSLERNTPPSTPILSSSVTVSAAEQASWLQRPERLVGICAMPTFLTGQLVELAPTVHTSSGAVTGAKAAIVRCGKEVAVVQDRIGMVLPRIVCMLVNEAAFNVMEGTATPQDIDTAMKLGTNYPYGPIEWAENIGVGNVVAVLEALHRDLGEERYRVCPLLRQLSHGKKWW